MKRQHNLFPIFIIFSMFFMLSFFSFETSVYAHSGHDSSILIPYTAPEGLSVDFINNLVKPTLPLPDVEPGKVNALDVPWNWPSMENGSMVMNTIHSSRTDSDGDGLKECRYFYKLDSMTTYYTAAEITEIENAFDRAFKVWNTTINQLGLEFKRVYVEGDSHMLVKSVNTLGSGTPAQASLFGAFFYSGISPMVPELAVNENYTNFGNYTDLVVGANSKIKMQRPAGNPYVNVISFWDLSKTSEVNSVDYERNDPVYRTAIHEIGHLLGFNHTFDSLQNSATTNSTEYMVDWLAYTDINTAYASMSITNSYDGENPLTSGAVRGLNNSFMTYDERTILSYIDATPHQKAALAFIYRDVKGDSRVSAAALLASAKAEYEKYNTFKHSRIKCEVEYASSSKTTNNTKDNAMEITIGDSVLGSICAWASTSDQQNSGADTGDYYSFTVTTDMLNKPIYFDIDFGSSMFACRLEVLNSAENVLSAEPASDATMWNAATQWDGFSGGKTYPDPGSHYDKHPTQGSSMNVPDPFIIYTPTTAGTYYVKVTRNTYLDTVAGGQPWPSAWGDYYLRTSLDAVTAKPTVTCSEGTSFTTATPTINWTAAANASEYILEYRKQGASEWIRNDKLGISSSKQLSLTEAASYEVRVMGYNAMNENLNSQVWSDTLTIARVIKYKLTVNITPLLAAQSGVKWKTSLDDTWIDSGSYYEMAAGTNVTLTLKRVRGWLSEDGTYTLDYTQGAADYSDTVNHIIDTSRALTVTISNAAAITAGAKWRLTAPVAAEAGFNDWKDSGTSLNLYNTEAYTIEFNAVEGYTKPANVTGTMGAANAAVASGDNGVGSYIDETKKKITATISPQSAIDAGAKWRTSLDETWLDSGSSYEVTVGTKFTTECNKMRGWAIIGNQTSGEITMPSADIGGTFTYAVDTPHAFTVNISNAAAVTAGAKWRLTAPTGITEAGFYDWKTTGSSLNLYNQEIYTVEFGAATGYTSPFNVIGTMGTAAGALTTGADGLKAYTLITHNLTVNIAPAEAVTAGAQWQIATDGATWRNSGTSAALPENTDYTVSFKALTGYGKPANQTGTLIKADVALSASYTVDVAPTLTFTSPGTTDVTANSSVNITWTDEDADSSAVISLYLDKTTTWQGDGSELLLLANISEDADGTADLQDKLMLSNTSTDGRVKMKDIPAGKYYVLAVLDDSNHAVPTKVWSTGKLIVDHAGTISDVLASNIKSTTASISYISKDSGTAVVNYSLSNGTLDSTENDTRGATDRIIHNVALTGLTAATAYKYNAQLNLATPFEGMASFKSDNIGENYSFTTALAAQTRVPGTYVITGKVLDEDGVAVNEALVVITIDGAANSGTANQGQTSQGLSVLSGADGAFSFDLANLIAPDGDGFLYAANDIINLKVRAGTKGQYEGTYPLGSNSPQALGNITARAQYTQKIVLKTGFNLISFPLDFTAAPITARTLFASNPALAAVYSWNTSTQSYSSTIKADATTVIGDVQTITPGFGYWIKASSGVTIEVTGKILTNPTTLNLKNGFNLVGFGCAKDYPTSLAIDGYKSTDAQSGADTSYTNFINSITDSEGKCASAIYSWNSSTSSYDGVLLLNNEPYLIKAFSVELINAYFIKVVRDVSYTPAK